MKLRQCLSTFLIFCLCMLTASPSFAVIHSDKVYDIYDDVVLDPTTRFYFYKTPKIEVKVTYPVIKSDIEDENIDQLNQLITDMIKEERTQFRKTATEFLNNPDNPHSNSDKSTLNIDFNASIVNGDGSPTLSLRFSLQGFIPGMAHPRTYHRTITYDIYNGHQLSMYDLFNPDSDYLPVIAQNSEEILSRHLKYKSMIHDGVKPTEDNFRNWNITPYGLMITFDSGQIAPRIYGTQSIVIPYSRLKDLLYTDSPVTACRKHRSHCMKHKVFTLGFREEA